MNAKAVVIRTKCLLNLVKYYLSFSFIEQLKEDWYFKRGIKPYLHLRHRESNEKFKTKHYWFWDNPAKKIWINTGHYYNAETDKHESEASEQYYGYIDLSKDNTYEVIGFKSKLLAIIINMIAKMSTKY